MFLVMDSKFRVPSRAFYTIHSHDFFDNLTRSKLIIFYFLKLTSLEQPASYV